MSEKTFTFNGVNSSTVGLYLSTAPDRPMPKRKQTVYNIKGKSEPLIIDEDAFENYTVTYSVYARGSESDYQAQLRNIAKFLLSNGGYAALKNDYDPNVYLKARVLGGFNVNSFFDEKGKAKIPFDCCPLRYPVTEEVLTGTLGGANIVYPVTDMLPAYPIIHVQGTIAASESWFITIKNTGTVNSVAVSVSTGTAFDDLYIDYETRSVYTYLYDGPIIIGKVHPSRATFVFDPVWEKLTNNAFVNTTLNSGIAHPISVETRRFYL